MAEILLSAMIFILAFVVVLGHHAAKLQYLKRKKYGKVVNFKQYKKDYDFREKYGIKRVRR